MAHVIDGNALAEELRQSIDDEFQVLRLSEVKPGLATVIVGEDGGARAYERHVRQLAEGLEYHYTCEELPAGVEVADVLATIGKLNADPRVTGILVLHPLPDHLPEAEINTAIDPLKDKSWDLNSVKVVPSPEGEPAPEPRKRGKAPNADR